MKKTWSPVNLFEIVLLFILIAVGNFSTAAQTVAPTPVDKEKFAEAESLIKEVTGLVQKNTPEAFKAAAEKLPEAISLFEEAGANAEKGAAIFLLGAVNMRLENPRTALENCSEALSISQTVGHKDLQFQVLIFIAQINSTLSEWDKANDAYSKALALANEIENADYKTKANAGVLLSASKTPISLDTLFLQIMTATLKPVEEMRNSFPLCSRAFEKIRESNDKTRLAKTYWQCGILYKKASNSSRNNSDLQNTALEYFTKAIESAKETNDLETEYSASNWLADLLQDRLEFQKSIEFFTRTLAIARQLKNKKFEGQSLRRLGDLYFSAGDSDQAAENFKASIALHRENGDFDSAAASLHYLGWSYREMGDYENALKYFQEALAAFKSLKEKDAEIIMTMRNTGDTYRRLGDMSKALAILQEAFALAEKTKKSGEQATILHEIGRIYTDTDNYFQAMTAFQKSLKITERNKDLRGSGNNWNDMAKLYETMGDSDKAEEFYIKTFMAGTMLNDGWLIINSFPNFARGGIRVGKRQEIVTAIEKVSALVKKQNNAQMETVFLLRVAELYEAMGNRPKQLEYLQQTLPLFVAQGNKRGERDAHIGLAFAYWNADDKLKSFAELDKALELAKQTGDLRYQAYLWQLNGLISEDSQNNSQKVFPAYRESLQIYRSAGDKRGESNVLNRLMQFSEASGNKRLAVFYGKLAVNYLQEIRGATQGIDVETQKSLLKNVQDVYRSLAHYLIAQNRLAEAQQILNIFKDQQFFDFNNTKNKQTIKISLTPREAELTVLYEKSANEVSNAGKLLTDAKRRPKKNQSESEIKKLEADLKTAAENFQNVIRRTETEFAQNPTEKDTVGTVPDLTEMQTALREMHEKTKQKTVALYTIVGINNFRILVVTPDDIFAVNQTVKGETINEKSLQLWRLLQSPAYDPTKLSQQLYDIVFRQVADKLPADTKTILWSLDGNLRYIPMAALYDGERYLVEKYNHVNFTRADRERMTRPVSPNWTASGFGTSNAQTVEMLGNQIKFSSLPGVKEELEAIFKSGSAKAGIFDGEVFADENFTKPAMISALQKKRPLVHISSHFSFRPGDEALSFLLLGDGTGFSLAEMKEQKDLFAGVDLLTLSACNTAAAQSNATGKEIDGFAELAQRLGAGAVMATLWQVSDSSTPELMKSFYEIRQTANGVNKAEALRQAQLAMLKGMPTTVRKETVRSDLASEIQSGTVELIPFQTDEKKPFAHPYYWSPFVLIGNWR